MYVLLQSQNFGKITVRDICEKALISRATFYAHFIDKYDLLECFLTQLIPKDVKTDYSYEQVEKNVNEFVYKNELIIKNILQDIDNETFGILFKLTLSNLNKTTRKSNERMNPKDIVLSNVFAGGMLHYLLWQLNNKFPADVPPMNIFLFHIIEQFWKWDSEIS